MVGGEKAAELACRHRQPGYQDAGAAAVVSTNSLAWTVEEHEQLAADLADLVDESLGRMIVALALTHGGPIQEHLTTFGPRYMDSNVGRDPVPLAVVWSRARMRRYNPGFNVERLLGVASAVASVRNSRRLAVAARRYFQAGAERTPGRPDCRLRHRDRGHHRHLEREGAG